MGPVIGESAAILGELKMGIAVHNAAILVMLLLVLGVKLNGDAIGGFSS